MKHHVFPLRLSLSLYSLPLAVSTSLTVHIPRDRPPCFAPPVQALISLYLQHVSEVFIQLASWLKVANGNADLCARFLEGPVKHGGYQKVER